MYSSSSSEYLVTNSDAFFQLFGNQKRDRKMFNRLQPHRIFGLQKCKYAMSPECPRKSFQGKRLQQEFFFLFFSRFKHRIIPSKPVTSSVSNKQVTTMIYKGQLQPRPSHSWPSLTIPTCGHSSIFPGRNSI
jgi:hypothetical protein